MDLSRLDLDKLAKDTAHALAGAIQQIVEGAEEDVRIFASAISRDLLTAKFSGDKAMVTQLLAQLRVVGELNRLRAEAATWAIVRSVTEGVLKAAVSGALAVLV